MVALSGIFLAYLMYIKKTISPQVIGEKFKLVHKFLFNKWYWDEIYDFLVINPTLWLTEFLFKFDKYG